MEEELPHTFLLHCYFPFHQSHFRNLLKGTNNKLKGSQWLTPIMAWVRCRRGFLRLRSSSSAKDPPPPPHSEPSTPLCLTAASTNIKYTPCTHTCNGVHITFRLIQTRHHSNIPVLLHLSTMLIQTM